MSNPERKEDLSNESREVTRRVHVCVFCCSRLQGRSTGVVTDMIHDFSTVPRFTCSRAQVQVVGEQDGACTGIGDYPMLLGSRSCGVLRPIEASMQPS